MSVEGTLSAVGSSGSPITFTSINDNSVGGGGGTGSPAGGDWYGILATGSGSIDLEHANFSYSRWGVQTNTTGSVTVKSNAFASQSQQAVGIFAAAAPTLQNNSSSDVAQGWQAFEIQSSSLDASRLGGNSATGTGEQVVGLGGTIATSSTLPAEPAAWQIGNVQTLIGGGDGSLDVPSGVTLTIAPGAVLKGLAGTGCANVLCTMSVEGTLSAVGSSGSPITFTSINDNSVGGGGGSGSPAGGDWYGILATGSGSIDLDTRTSATRGGVCRRIRPGR